MTLRVLLVAQRLPPYFVGGAERQAIALAHALTRAGAAVRFLTTRFQPGQPLVDEIEGLAVTRVPSLPGRAHKPTALALVARQVARHAGDIDVVHASALSSSALGATVGARLAGKPVVVKPSIAGAGGEIERIRASVALPLLAPVLRQVTRFAIVDPRAAHELLALGVDGARLRAIDNGVDLACFRPPASPGEKRALRERLGLPVDEKLVLFAGQLIERKGLATLLAAWRHGGRGRGARLLVAGRGPLEGELARATTAHDDVIAMGARTDVGELMRASDLFVLPSRNEGQSNAVLEALASGLPVIATRSPDPARVDLEALGRAVLPDDERALAAALAALLGDDAARARIAPAAREAAARFDLERVARDYLSLYEELLRLRSSV